MFLAIAGFASQAMVRSADSLLPQIASDMGVLVGVASIIVSVYSLIHGSMQLVMGPIGDPETRWRCFRRHVPETEGNCGTESSRKAIPRPPQM